MDKLVSCFGFWHYFVNPPTSGTDCTTFDRQDVPRTSSQMTLSFGCAARCLHSGYHSLPAEHFWSHHQGQLSCIAHVSCACLLVAFFSTSQNSARNEMLYSGQDSHTITISHCHFSHWLHILMMWTESDGVESFFRGTAALNVHSHTTKTAFGLHFHCQPAATAAASSSISY